MNPTNEIIQRKSVRNSIVAAEISLLCIGVCVIYLFAVEKMTSEEIISYVPYPVVFSLFYVIPLVMLLRRPDANAITTSIAIGSLGLLFSVLFVPMAVLDWADSGTPLLGFVSVIYLACQIWLIYEGVQWRARMNR